MCQWVGCLVAWNVYDLLPASTVRSVSIVLMIIHQCFAYAMFIMPVHHMWEKLIRTHAKPYWIRLPSRLPVGKPQPPRFIPAAMQYWQMDTCTNTNTYTYT